MRDTWDSAAMAAMGVDYYPLCAYWQIDECLCEYDRVGNYGLSLFRFRGMRKEEWLGQNINDMIIKLTII